MSHAALLIRNTPCLIYGNIAYIPSVHQSDNMEQDAKNKNLGSYLDNTELDGTF